MLNIENQKILAIVESPLQFLCALEYINKHKTAHVRVILRLNSNETNNNQLFKIASHFENEKTSITSIKINENSPNLLDKIRIAAHVLLTRSICGNYNLIVMGNEESKFLKPIYKTIRCNKLIFVDDGSKTLGSKNDSTKSKYQRFTFFQSQNISQQESITLHAFENIKSSFSSKITINENDIGFIGAPLSEFGIIEESFYIQKLNQIAIKLPKKRHFYFPHRSESIDKIKKISDATDFIIKPLDYPLEMIGIESQNIPGEFYSFYSTALYTLGKIYNCKTYYIQINPLRYKAEINAVYGYYKQHLNQCVL